VMRIGDPKSYCKVFWTEWRSRVRLCACPASGGFQRGAPSQHKLTSVFTGKEKQKICVSPYTSRQQEENSVQHLPFDWEAAMPGIRYGKYPKMLNKEITHLVTMNGKSLKSRDRLPSLFHVIIQDVCSHILTGGGMPQVGRTRLLIVSDISRVVSLSYPRPSLWQRD
jgi:hypothetical protein